ncbi:DM13 domain-containing protein [Deinococcus sp.]|uniref:DM13 domain-containing protein n=1 Tax=Deinococcus sp. TaxID=47478 RepID=UPI002869D1BB|nr:DM13 domain-containing protein [Deinococcus sp.]
MKTLNRTALTVLAALTLVPLAAAATMTPGTFHSLHAPTSGTVSIVQQGGKPTLQLKNFKTEAAPDLQVWLYRDGAPAEGSDDTKIAKGKYVKVGVLKTFSGNFSFALPAGTKVSDYKSVVLWCDLVSTAFGAADLK